MSEIGKDTLIGQPIGNYVVKSLLGSGGMGSVYLAEHPAIGRRVAIKVLAAHLSVHERLSERFLSEARALALIEHPNVIEIYDFGKLPDGRLFYVMEQLKGQELGKMMNQRGRLSARDVLPVLEQICHGLQATHEKGIIHRDLKPENIFVLERAGMVIKLLDFGIAKLQQVGAGSASLTQTGMVMGTPLYIAPEQASGEVQKIGPQTDIYSLGVIIYWMLAGRPPFFDETPALLLAQHISSEVPPVRSVFPTVPVAVARVVERCLEKKPGDRHASARELLAAFSAAVEEADAEQAAGDAEIPSPDMVHAPTSATAEAVIEFTSDLGEPEATLTGPPERTGEARTAAVDPDRTAPQLQAGVGPTSDMPAAGDAARTVPSSPGTPSRVELTMPVPVAVASGESLAATTPAPVEEPLPKPAGTFSLPDFPTVMSVGPSSSEITAKLPESREAIATAGAEAAAAFVAPAPARTTLRAAAGELTPKPAVSGKTWLVIGGLAAALLLVGGLLFTLRQGPTTPGEHIPATAPAVPEPDSTPMRAAAAPDSGAAQDSKAVAVKRQPPKPRKEAPSRRTLDASSKVNPAPAKAVKPPAHDPFQPKPKPNPAKKPKKIGEGTMEF